MRDGRRPEPRELDCCLCRLETLSKLRPSSKTVPLLVRPTPPPTPPPGRVGAPLPVGPTTPPSGEDSEREEESGTKLSFRCVVDGDGITSRYRDLRERAMEKPRVYRAKLLYYNIYHNTQKRLKPNHGPINNIIHYRCALIHFRHVPFHLSRSA